MAVEDSQHGLNMAVSIPTLKSLLVEMHFEDKLLSTGTAFLITRNKESNCVLITNRHNVTGRRQDNNECLSRTLAIPDSITIYFYKNSEIIGDWIPIKIPLYRKDGSPYWIEHPQFGASADMVALNLTWGCDVRLHPYYLDLDLDKCNMVLDPAEPVSVIGFPFGKSSAGKFPIWATGFLAQDLSIVSEDNPTFYIDCRSRQGQSGSPVIAYRNTGIRFNNNGRIASTLSPDPKWEFLGIYCGRVNAESDLGIVWHVSFLGDLFDAAIADLNKRALVITEKTDRTECPQVNLTKD